MCVRGGSPRSLVRSRGRPVKLGQGSGMWAALGASGLFRCFDAMSMVLTRPGRWPWCACPPPLLGRVSLALAQAVVAAFAFAFAFSFAFAFAFSFASAFVSAFAFAYAFASAIAFAFAFASAFAFAFTFAFTSATTLRMPSLLDEGQVHLTNAESTSASTITTTTPSTTSTQLLLLYYCYY